LAGRQRGVEFDYDDDAGAPPAATPFDWAWFVLRAAWRRKLLAIALALASFASSVAYLAAKKPMYRAEAKVLAQRGQALPSAARSVFEDLPTRSAWEMIHRRENLVSLARDAQLLPVGAPPQEAMAPHSLLDWILRRPPHPAADPLDVVVTVLDRRLMVGIDEGTITISIDWSDPRQAYDIVKAALESFLEARHVQEVTAIDESISALQARAASLRDDLEAAVEAAHRNARTPRVVAPAVKRASPELLRLRGVLDSKLRAIQDVEEYRRRRLAELQAQLDQARNTLSEGHPTVIGLKNDIEALSRESPQVKVLRDEEHQARTEYDARLAREGTADQAVNAPAPIVLPDRTVDQDERVRNSRFQYEQMLARVNTARAEADAARAAFKYRYNVVWPPQVPREPISPKPFKILGFGLLGSIALALAAAAAPDILRGRICEQWQVERVLRLPVLGTLDKR
jgi:uncharacterized protein involved in exopolysaccharide biosynthesis